MVTGNQVVKARMEHYGHPSENFGNIARLWNAYFNSRFDADADLLSAEDVGFMLVLLKVARTINNPPINDSIVDIYGYAKCVELIRKSEGDWQDG